MKRAARIAMFIGLAACGDAFALGSIANITIIDRDGGAALGAYYYHGEYWVAGRPGARYAIEIRNRSGGRLLAVTSVDGINVLSGATAGWDQAGYVFDPGERYQITGWRKSNAEVAAFTFTESPNSYAERTGRPANVGVIGVALFRERQPQPVYAPPKVAASPQEPAARQREQNELSAQAAGPSGGRASDEALARAPGAALAAPGTRLGTGHGERESSYVVDTEFHRMQSEPNEVIRIRYDSLENLVAMGIVRRTQPAWTAPNPFPGSGERQFVPDPPG